MDYAMDQILDYMVDYDRLHLDYIVDCRTQNNFPSFESRSFSHLSKFYNDLFDLIMFSISLISLMFSIYPISQT